MLTVSVVKTKEEQALGISFANRYSSYPKALRIYSWLRRFTANVRIKDRELRNLSSRLSVQEIESTEIILLSASQQRTFPTELEDLKKGNSARTTSPIIQRHPMLGTDGLMRVGRRLQHSSLPYDSKHPVIIHGRDPLARTLVAHLHNTSLHALPTSLVGLISLRFDIVGAKRLAKEVSAGCHVCHRHYAKVASQLMGQLPSCRLSISSSFSEIGSRPLRWSTPTKNGPRPEANNDSWLFMHFCVPHNQSCAHRGGFRPHHRGLSCMFETIHWSSRSTFTSI